MVCAWAQELGGIPAMTKSILTTVCSSWEEDQASEEWDQHRESPTQDPLPHTGLCAWGKGALQHLPFGKSLARLQVFLYNHKEEESHFGSTLDGFGL